MKKTILLLSCFLPIMFIFGQKSKNKNENAMVNNPPLIETYWLMKSIDGKAVEGKFDIYPYIYFEKGGMYYGSTGCNTYFGKYTHKKGKLKMNYSGATKKLCKNMSSETAFFKAFRQEISHYKIEGEQLTLYAKDKIMIVCKAGEDPNLNIETKSEYIEIPTLSPTQNEDKVEKEEEKEVEEIRD